MTDHAKCQLCGCSEDNDYAEKYYHMTSHVLFEENEIQGGCSTA